MNRKEYVEQKWKSRLSRCTLCKQYKDFDEFYSNKNKPPFYLSTECKQCQSNKNRKTDRQRPTYAEIKERLETQTAICSKCKNKKCFSDFYKDKRNVTGLMAYCKNCEQERTNLTRVIMKSKLSVEEKLEYNKHYNLLYNFNITLEDYYTMLKNQNYVCKICKREETAKCNYNKGKIRNLAVDHCHTTGKVRGLLCRKCNHSLGLLNESIDTLQNMIKYIEEYNMENTR